MADNGNGAFWFLAGIGIGTVIGVLYAPQSGTETRGVLRSKAEEAKELARERTRQAREQASEWVDKGKEVVNQQKDQLRTAVEAGKQAYRETTSGIEPKAAKG
jgi:gas vesicle protein